MPNIYISDRAQEALDDARFKLKERLGIELDTSQVILFLRSQWRDEEDFSKFEDAKEQLKELK